jgi:hypothetical protein
MLVMFLLDLAPSPHPSDVKNSQGLTCNRESMLIAVIIILKPLAIEMNPAKSGNQKAIILNE